MGSAITGWTPIDSFATIGFGFWYSCLTVLAFRSKIVTPGVTIVGTLQCTNYKGKCFSTATPCNLCDAGLRTLFVLVSCFACVCYPLDNATNWLYCSAQVAPDCSDYDEGQAWPLLLDNYVEYKRSQ